MAYSVGMYRDPENARRNRYAVACDETGVWYFPKRYGIKPANDLCARMNGFT